MSRLLHISASPRGANSVSLKIAAAYLAAYEGTHPDDEIDQWDLWDGSLPPLGRAGANAKMTVFGGGEPEGEDADAWRAARLAFERFDAADRLLFSVPMWNAGVPYVLKQLIDVVSQPGWIFDVDPTTGYRGLLAGRGKQATVIYTSAVWGPGVAAEFGRDFQSTYLADWLEWTGISDVTEIRYHPTLTGDVDAALAAAVETAEREARGPATTDRRASRSSSEEAAAAVRRGSRRGRRGSHQGRTAGTTRARTAVGDTGEPHR